MPTQVQSILRKATRKKGELLNLLIFMGENHYDMSLAETGHNFMVLNIPGAKGWNPCYPIPKNYTVIPNSNNQARLPLYLDFDAIIIHDRLQQYDVASLLNVEYQLPLILVQTLIRLHSM